MPPQANGSALQSAKIPIRDWNYDSEEDFLLDAELQSAKIPIRDWNAKVESAVGNALQIAIS